MNQLIHAINNLTSFTIQYNKIKNDYDSFKDFWEGADFEDEPEKLYPTDDLKIMNVNVVRNNNFTLKCNETISLAPGQKIYIEGPTGEGKSTFLKALLGQISGAKSSTGEMKNYYHYVANYFQEIKEKMPSSKISIRNYFKNADDNSIEKYLLRVFSYDELDLLKNNLINQKNEDIIDVNLNKSPYDMAINEKISGGQKSRLLLTLKGYEADINKKGIIVLDEPCPDVDDDTYINIINLFFENYKHCTIIMCCHLCPCKKSKLKIQWDQKYSINKGLIMKI